MESLVQHPTDLDFGVQDQQTERENGFEGVWDDVTEHILYEVVGFTLGCHAGDPLASDVHGEVFRVETRVLEIGSPLELVARNRSPPWGRVIESNQEAVFLVPQKDGYVHFTPARPDGFPESGFEMKGLFKAGFVKRGQPISHCWASGKVPVA
jgi:hypothetical protein